MIQAFDACVLDGDDEGRGTGAVGTVVDGGKEGWVVVGYCYADDEGTENVEGEQTVDKSVGGFRNVASGVVCQLLVSRYAESKNLPGSFGFSSCGDHQFRAHDEGESRFNEGVPESKELATVALGNEWVKGALMIV